jgi:Domain of unknown function (DUF4123)
MQFATSSSTADATSTSQALHQAAQAHSEGMLWLAVDANPGAGESLADELQSALDSVMAQTVRLDHPEVDKAWRPRWLPMNTEQAKGSSLLQDSIAKALAELMPQALNHGGGRRISGWIQLDDEVEQAAVHIGRQMIRRHPQGHRCLLRLHDPAVLWALWPLLTPAQQRQLLGPINTWWLLDPNGQLTALRCDDRSAAAEPWAVEQWADIDNITPMNRALRNWLAAPEASTALLLPEAHRIAIQALRRARAAGFTHDRDLGAFALHALAVHPQFDHHPQVQRALAKREPADQYTALIEALSEQDWLDVRANRNLV